MRSKEYDVSEVAEWLSPGEAPQINSVSSLIRRWESAFLHDKFFPVDMAFMTNERVGFDLKHTMRRLFKYLGDTSICMASTSKGISLILMPFLAIICRTRNYLACAEAGNKPSCCTRPSASAFCQASAIWPFMMGTTHDPFLPVSAYPRLHRATLPLSAAVPGASRLDLSPCPVRQRVRLCQRPQLGARRPAARFA